LLGSATTRWLVEDNAPTITLKALVTFGDKTKEGQLILGVRIAWNELCRRFANKAAELFNMNLRKLEELIAGAYDVEGYDVILTPRSADRGRDIIGTRRDGAGSITIFDQIKRNRIDRPVTREEVSALMGELDFHQNVSKGVITTTSSFAP